MIYNLEIKRALTVAFNTLLSAYTVKWPNSNFVTPNAQTWLKFNIMIGDLFELTLRETDRINGIVQIDVMMEKLKGENPAFVLADILTTNLPKNGVAIVNGSTKVFIKNVKPPRIANDNNWHRMIIEVSFYSFVPR